VTSNTRYVVREYLIVDYTHMFEDSHAALNILTLSRLEKELELQTLFYILLYIYRERITNHLVTRKRMTNK